MKIKEFFKNTKVSLGIKISDEKKEELEDGIAIYKLQIKKGQKILDRKNKL